MKRSLNAINPRNPKKGSQLSKLRYYAKMKRIGKRIGKEIRETIGK